MYFNIEPSSSVPIYRQLIDQIRLSVASGRLQPGQKLPGSRKLAERVDINLHTVNKAYQELVREGTLNQKRGVGTFVADEPAVLKEENVDVLLEDDLQKLIQNAKAYGLSREEFNNLVEEYWDEDS